MIDAPFPNPEQERRFGFSWDSIDGFGPYMDFWQFYETLVTAAPPHSTIVEIGCFQGRSLVCLGLFAREAGKGLKIVGVDNNLWDGAATTRENLKRAGLSDSVQFMEMGSTLAASSFADGSLFCAFIDGEHSHGVVEADVRAWMPKIQVGGWLAGHDFRMFTVCQPVCALFGERLVYDQRWPDIWAVPKCEPATGVDIHKCNGRMPDFTGEWRP